MEMAPPSTLSFFVGDTKPVLAIQHLDGKGFVQLPRTDVSHGETEALEQPRNGEHGSNAHFIRLGPGNRHAEISTQRCQAALCSQFATHDDAGGGAVGELRCVAGSDDAALHDCLQAASPSAEVSGRLPSSLSRTTSFMEVVPLACSPLPSSHSPGQSRR